jgi:hypothetical protein
LLFFSSVADWPKVWRARASSHFSEVEAKVELEVKEKLPCTLLAGAIRLTCKPCKLQINNGVVFVRITYWIVWLNAFICVPTC